MGNYINGYNKPRFRITDISGVLVEIIDLPICMVQGLTESYKKLFKTHELQNRALVNFDYKGERISFTLDYSSLIVKPTALQIQNLENYLDSFDDYKVYLYPRVDNLSRFFEVTLPQDYGYNLNIHNNGQNAIGNKGVIPTVITKFAVPKNWQDPDNLSRPLPFNLK